MVKVSLFLKLIAIIILSNFNAEADFVVNSTVLVQQFQSLEGYSLFGILSSAESLNSFENLFPKPDYSQKDVPLLKTLNGYGFDSVNSAALKNVWILPLILSFSRTCQKPILDIGGGFGRLASFILNQSCPVIILNDLDPRHLMYARGLISVESREKLHLNVSKFPNEMNFQPGSLSAVILYKVLHYLNPKEIEEGLKKIFDWLEPGGKVFIDVVTPQHSRFQKQALAVYNKRWKEGDLWPGYQFNTYDLIGELALDITETIHLMDSRPLLRVLKELDFVIEQAAFSEFDKIENEDCKSNGQEGFGVIARKK